jgi:hypothetical protein
MPFKKEKRAGLCKVDIPYIEAEDSNTLRIRLTLKLENTSR